MAYQQRVENCIPKWFKCQFCGHLGLSLISIRMSWNFQDISLKHELIDIRWKIFIIIPMNTENDIPIGVYMYMIFGVIGCEIFIHSIILFSMILELRRID